MTDGHPFAHRRGRKVRARHLAGEPCCRDCLARGRVRPAEQVHHVVPISRGGAPFDPANLASLCGDCHLERHGHRRKPEIDPLTGLRREQ